MLDETQIRRALAGILPAERVSGIAIRGEEGAWRVGFLIAAEADDVGAEALAQRAATAVRGLPGVLQVTPVLTAEHAPSPQAAPTPAPRAQAVWHREPLPHVGRILAIASGKGGVGKSTLAVGLAHALHARGERVGLLDLDIHGPSLPRMLGIRRKPEVEDGMLVPVMAQGIACLSSGFLIEENQAAVMRGPMVTKLLKQFLRMARWGTAASSLDTLVIDLPPGTGDIQLSLAQTVPVTGALIITTPQAVALADARKAAAMFAQVGIPILGIVENMSWFESAGMRSALFGEGGGAMLAAETGAPLLAQLPLDPLIGQALDRGERPPLGAFEAIAAKL